MDYSTGASICTPGKNTEVGNHSLSRESSQPGIEPGVSTLQTDSLSSESPRERSCSQLPMEPFPLSVMEAFHIIKQL